MRKKLFPIVTIAVFIVLVIAIVGITGLIKKYKPSDEKANVEKYFGEPGQDEFALTIDNQVVGVAGKVIDGVSYIEYETVSEYLNSRFYWDANENKLLYTLPTDIVTAATGSSDYYVTNTKQSEDYVIVKADGNKTYIAVKFLSKYTNMSFEMHKDPQRMTVMSTWGKKKTAEVKKNTQIREKGGIKSPILTEIEKKDKVFVLEEGDSWTKVCSQDGYAGYIQNKRLSDVKEENYSREFDEPEFTNISKDYTINLAWHQVTTARANNDILSTIAGTKGLTTLSPTWFSISDNKGNISSLASSQYVNYAHQSGIEVWGLVDNFTEGVDTHEVLSYSSKRETLVNQLIGEALKVGLDGINVDFENVPEETGDSYIQFIRELSVKCRNNGLVLSVDNYVPQEHTRHYNRKEQGIVADYVIIMGYDEHYGSSPESGSVASIGFVEEGIKKTLDEVPAEKVINGIPFYTRLWKEVPKTEEELAEQEGTDAASYPNKVTSEVKSMDNAENIAADAVNNYGIEKKWDEEAAQYYIEYEADGAVYKMWIEDARSIEAKLELIKEYKLAGVAEWKLGLESADIWEVILKYVN